MIHSILTDLLTWNTDYTGVSVSVVPISRLSRYPYKRGVSVSVQIKGLGISTKRGKVRITRPWDREVLHRFLSSPYSDL
jgi:hypothetical protein